jgi:chlorobactene glucosyltransferase
LTLPLLLTLPWVGAAAVWAFAVIVRRAAAPPSGDVSARLPSPPPLVSVIIPARNEAHNIERVVTTVAASTYPRFEVIVVDDKSEDGTGDVARRLSRGNAERLEVVGGEQLPKGWLGKPWACAQGVSHARGEILLFTDADTTHTPELLARAVVALESADLVTVMGRQLMESFWERLVQPQVFAMILSRFAHVKGQLRPSQWRDAIANGQYLLFRRSAYDALGGHAAVRHEVVEDLRLAQIVVAGGWRLSMLVDEDAFATRMYRSLREMWIGWSKNMAIGAKQSVPPLLRPVVMPLSILALTALWIAPPVLLLASLAGFGAEPLRVWALCTVGVSMLLWASITRAMGQPFAYGLIYPLGSAVVVAIVTRSWLRGSRVQWKDREYRVEQPAA